MTITAAAIRLMAEKGLTSSDIAEIAEAMEAGQAQRVRSANAERQARFRASRRASTPQSVTHNVTRNVTPPNDIYSNPPEISPSPIGDSPQPRRKRQSKPDEPLPADWKPILTDRAKALVAGWSAARLAAEVEKFKNHAADKGRTSKDWQAAFRTWIENADGRFAPPARAGPANDAPAWDAIVGRRSSG